MSNETLVTPASARLVEIKRLVHAGEEISYVAVFDHHALRAAA